MRTVQTFILRLLVDPAEPKALRGALQPLPEGEVQFFQDENTLLDLLRRHTAVLEAIAAQPIEPEEEASP
ncbi:MAG: hypothetical protein RMN53_17850 [Anaerolineae bacterium]|nr:hypothetical protein [Anaerolineae bacterium]